MFNNRAVVILAASPLFFMSSVPWASQPQTGFIAHEWGTFTSLQDSEGHSREGMYHSDEALPDFVHSRLKDSFARIGSSVSTVAQCAHCTKGVEFPPKSGTAFGVTQKMETPVIYFYSAQEQHVKVDVDFPGGLITQWYPQATSYTPAINAAHSVSNGHITWDVDVSKKALPIPAVAFGSIWSPSREVNSNYVSVGGESEKLVFYRGLGHFDTAMEITSTNDGGLNIRNRSEQTIPSAFLISVTEQGGSVTALGAVSDMQSLRVNASAVASPAIEPMDAYLQHATTQVVEALVRSGLYRDEAQAMVNTWRTSYFRTPGLRVLYVLPRSWTDQLLPLEMRPAPTELVRTLVGRVEVMTRAEEEHLLAVFQSANHAQVQAEVRQLGRFAEPKLQRVAELARERGLNVQIQSLISTEENLASQNLE